MSALTRCEYCASLNAAITTSCSNCGMPRSKGRQHGDMLMAGASRASVPQASPSMMRPSASPPIPATENMYLGVPQNFQTQPQQPSRSFVAPPSLRESVPSTPSAMQSTRDPAAASTVQRSAQPRTLNDVLSSALPLIGTNENGSYSEVQVRELLDVIHSAQRFGREIEQSLEELSELLRKKTLECDGLRKLAQENYDPLRKAIRHEYDARVKQESRHAGDQRRLLRELDSVKNERVRLQQELESLRGLVKELQSVPQPVDHSRSTSSVFNSMAGIHEGVTSWSPQDRASTIPELRDLMNDFTMLTPQQARAMENAGLFNFMRVLCSRLSTLLPDGTTPELGGAVADLLRDMRNGADLASLASQPINTLQPSIRQRISQLYLANRPREGHQLALLLDEYAGREDELHARLKREFAPFTDANFDEFEEPMTMQQRLGFQSAADAKAGSASIQPTTKNASIDENELHARCILMYRKYNPSKALSNEVQELMKKYAPDVLLAALVEKYGPEPTISERKQLVRSLMEEADRMK